MVRQRTASPSAIQQAARQIDLAGSGSRLQSISQIPEGTILPVIFVGVTVLSTAMA
jgi:hypothetical protein